MPIIQKTAALAANTTVSALAGEQFEFISGRPAIIEFGINGSATGLTASLFIGAETLAEGINVNIQNRFCIFPDDIICKDVANVGDKLTVKINNTTGGALNWFLTVSITYL